MRVTRLFGAVLLLACVAAGGRANASGDEDAYGPGILILTVAANVVPVLSAVYAPQCLPGYVVCKLALAGMSLIAAAGQIGLAGGVTDQTRAILYRGLGGDWYLTPRHVSGEIQAEPLPDPPPPEGTSEPDEYEPPIF